MSFSRATLIGFGAVLLWGLLALLTALSGPTPPFQQTAFCLGLGGLVGLIDMARRGASLRAAFAQPWAVWAVGVGGLFGYHAVYFYALKHAPAAEASLIAYLWPLLIVLLAGLAAGERPRPLAIVGALMGFMGAALVILGKTGFRLEIDPAYAPGYLAAFACAFIWSGYSLLSRRLGEAPTDAVAGFCLVSALLGALCHLAFESETLWPRDGGEWTALILLGIGPVGAAFYLWDHGVKRGDIQTLGALSYAAPLISTLALALAGLAEARWSLAAACLLIVGGAVLASRAART